MSPLRIQTCLAACWFLSLGLTAQSLAQQAKEPPGSSQSQNVLEIHLVGSWLLDVKATADILARGQFGTRQEITASSEATIAQTNLISKAFDPKKYEETRTFWATNLARMKYQVTFNSNGKGEASSYDPDAKKPIKSPLKWSLHGSALRLEYTDLRRPLTETGSLVSTNELHIPMEMLGGWFVLHKQKQAQ